MDNRANLVDKNLDPERPFQSSRDDAGRAGTKPESTGLVGSGAPALATSRSAPESSDPTRETLERLNVTTEYELFLAYSAICGRCAGTGSVDILEAPGRTRSCASCGGSGVKGGKRL